MDKIRLYKEISESYKRPIVTFEQELEWARRSIYFWFYVFISRGELEKRQSKKNIKSNLEIRPYGDLSLSFENWWERYGRFLFAERIESPPEAKVMNLDDRVASDNYVIPHTDILKAEAEAVRTQRSPLRRANYDMNTNKNRKWLAVELPLFIRRSALNRQIKAILDEYHPNKKIKLRKDSTAKLKLVDNRMRWATFEKIFKTYCEVNDSDGKPLWMIGEELKLSPVHNTLPKDNDVERRHKNRIMTLVVQRYYREGYALIKNAQKGIFPKKTLD